jgi:hypothetical protein
VAEAEVERKPIHPRDGLAKLVSIIHLQHPRVRGGIVVRLVVKVGKGVGVKV